MPYQDLGLLQEYQYWIFDMDGTLTLPVHDFKAIRLQLGIHCQTPILEWIDKLPKEQATAVYKELHNLEMQLAYQAQPQPFIDDLLQRLVSRGNLLGILTRNGNEMTQATLEAVGLSDYFPAEFILTRDCCEPKPDSRGVLLLLERWGASAEQTIIVGDYLYDLQAGSNAGIHTLHLDQTGQFPWPEFTHYQAQSIEEILLTGF